VEPLNRVSKGVEHPLCDILIGAGVNTPAAKRLRLFESARIIRQAKDDESDFKRFNI
jgi:hypothetical protein